MFYVISFTDGGVTDGNSVCWERDDISTDCSQCVTEQYFPDHGGIVEDATSSMRLSGGVDGTDSGSFHLCVAPASTANAADYVAYSQAARLAPLSQNLCACEALQNPACPTLCIRRPAVVVHMSSFSHSHQIMGCGAHESRISVIHRW